MSPTLKQSPAWTATYFEFRAFGTPHCPAWLFPHATISPWAKAAEGSSPRRDTVKTTRAGRRILRVSDLAHATGLSMSLIVDLLG